MRNNCGINSRTHLSGASGCGRVKYVYDLPYFERKELCRVLDENNDWETIGKRFYLGVIYFLFWNYH